MIEIDYDKLADAIVQKLRVLPPADKIIWTADQCADYLGMSRRHYVDRVSKTWGFPAAIKLPTDNGSRSYDRWYAADVQQWVTQYKKKI
jgi:predicted DNA-binding transcriptional regulator AlpA